MDDENKVECECCGLETDCSVPGALLEWGVFGQRGGGASNACPDCLRVIRFVVSSRRIQRGQSQSQPSQVT